MISRLFSAQAQAPRLGRSYNSARDKRGDAFVLLALLTGGAGLGYPLLGLLIHLVAIVLIADMARRERWQQLDPVGWLFLACGIGVVLLALVQLVPLPYSLWHMLPGREVAASIDAQLGWQIWRPISFTPDLTLRAALALLPPVAALLLMAFASHKRRIALIRLIVAVAVAGALLAFLQVAMGQGAPILYETTHRGYGVGLFVNRNHHAVLLLVAILLVALPGVVSGQRRDGRHARPDVLASAVPLAVAALLALGVLATSSRTGLVLLPFCLMLSVAIVARQRALRKGLAVIALLYFAAALLVAQTDALRLVVERFAWLREDLRFQYWENTLYALRASFPVGTGFGSFTSVYPTVEPLAQVGQLRVNHAHNDVLEFVLEGGIGAILLLLLFLGAIGHCIWRGLRAGMFERPEVPAALGGIAVIAAFTLVDFPLRLDAIACLAGLLLGLLTAPMSTRTRGMPARRGTRFALLAAVLAGGACTATLLGDALVLRGQPRLATTVAPWSARAWEARALDAQLKGDFGDSRTAAARALRIAPLNAGAVRAHGMTDIALGNPARGTALMLAGGALGWRDGVHQLWLAEAAIAARNPVIAAERIDAVLRRDLFSAGLLDQLRTLLDMPGGPQALAARLGDRPGWRQGLLNALAKDVPEKRVTILALLDLLRRQGIATVPHETELLRWAAADAGDHGLVRRLFEASGGQGGLAQGGFDGVEMPLPEAAAPYAWSAPRVAGVRLSVPQDAGRTGDALRVTASAMAGGELLRQGIALAPGRYRLDVLVGPRRAQPATGQFSWRITCKDGRALGTLAVPSDGQDVTGWKGLGIAFDVPQDCAAQKIALLFVPQGGNEVSVLFDNLSLRSLRRSMGDDKVLPGP